jgi:rubrerythrin
LDGQSSAQLNQLREIVDFAIAKEQEAIDFYTQLAASAKWESVANELRSIAAMEVGHKQSLQKMNVQVAATSVNPRATNLKIADYLVEIQPSDDMTWQDILNIAMRRELVAMNLYQDLANIVADATARQMFENLGAEESKHKLYFESIWDKEILTEN